jgi:hypothetical protein
MPVCEADPWRMQYFEGVDCPKDVLIPTEDCDAYQWYPKYRFVYNKMYVAESQGLNCGPHGLEPKVYPVFSKPIYNMRGMGAGSRKIKDRETYLAKQRPGHMWSELLAGEHVSTDVAVVNGQAKWWRHTTGIPLKGGTFDYWTVEAGARSGLESYCGAWIQSNLTDYTGMINLETIDKKIIEVHLRFADQWPDLYGLGWTKALITLYQRKIWEFKDDQRRDGYSVVLFGGHGIEYDHPPKSITEEILRDSKVSSLQITFHSGKAPELHSMPPGGFRLAILNGYDLEKLFRLRETLALSFWSTHNLTRPK